MKALCKESKRKKTEALLDPGNLLLLVYMTVIITFLLLGGLLDAAATVPEEVDFRLDEARKGELLMISEDGRLQPSPLLSQRVNIKVSGITARVVVEQRFINSRESWLEAVYVFPLPDESSVDHLRLRIGERQIAGKIMEKKEARKTHEKAKREGRKSSLLSQNRPNIFTTRVANIGPGEEVTVEIEYQQTVRFADNVFSLSFPMVVGPRYIPGQPLVDLIESSVGVSSTGWAVDTDQVPDASQITPPVDLTGQTENLVELTIDLAAGIPLARVESLYHGIESEEIEEDHYSIRLTSGVKADRDFVLEWQSKSTELVKAALFAESGEKNNQYMLLMLMPPQVATTIPVPREVVLVLDISGSMAGTSIEQAKAAIFTALQSLRPSDRFNIVVFNNSARTLFMESKPADQSHLQTANRFINSLAAEGGTEMKAALLRALDGSSHHERLRQVVFLTDGAVGNEDELFELIAKRLGDSRLFTVGIGSAPNSHFMTRAASMGRGTFTYIGKHTEVKEKMVNLFAKLEHPVISDLQLNLTGNASDIEIYPSPLPDLYAGEPLMLAIRTGWENENFRITGSSFGQPWKTLVDVSKYGKREGIGALWARKKIRSQMESLALGADKEKVREVVLQTALEHHLVSKYTSLVAVDSQVSKPKGAKEVQTAVKTALPHGWQAASLFGGGSQTATPAMLRLMIGAFLLVSAVLVAIFRRNRCQGYIR